MRPDDPWGAKPVTVKIRDVKAGWVRYDFTSGARDDRMRIADFFKIYRRVESDSHEEKESDWPEEIDVQ
jgi:hypothetical protein